MPLIVDGITGVTFNDASLQGAAASPFGLKNRIINGDMVIDQRNNGASVTPTATGYVSCDRWAPQLTQSSRFSVQQQTSVVPAGFTYAQRFTQLSSPTVSSGDYFGTEQTIEGFNIADLGFGSANAQTVTLSFWVRSSVTGTFCGSLWSAPATRSYVFNYTISSANTWEKKSITISGDTSGSYNTTNGAGLTVRFTFTAGSAFQTTAGSWVGANVAVTSGHTNFLATSGATFFITGVQLERNTTATPFEWIPYSTELALCQRYFYVIASGSGYFSNAAAQTTTNAFGMYTLPVTMRTAPTGSVVTGTNFYRFLANDTDDFVDSVYVNGQSPNNVIIGNSTQISNTQGRPGVFTAQNAASFVAASAEL